MNDFGRSSSGAPRNAAGQHRIARRSFPTGRNNAEQRRLLFMTFALMAVISLLFQAANPQNWKWLWWMTNTPLPTERAGELTGAGAPAPGSSATKTAPGPSAAAVAPQGTAEEPRVDGAELLSRLQQLPWDKVRDNTVFRQEEHPVWFGVWEGLQAVSDQELGKVSVGELGPIQLAQQMHDYRGKVVSTVGRIRRANYVSATSNDSHLAGYWQLWCEPPGGADFAVVIYALDYPAEAPRGMDVDVPCRVDGVLFKRWAYLAADGSRVAPLILARQIIPSATFQAAAARQSPLASDVGSHWPLLATVSLGSAGAAWILFRWSGRRPRVRQEEAP